MRNRNIGHTLRIRGIIVEVWREPSGWYWKACGAVFSHGPFRTDQAAASDAQRVIWQTSRRQIW